MIQIQTTHPFSDWSAAAIMPGKINPPAINFHLSQTPPAGLQAEERVDSATAGSKIISEQVEPEMEEVELTAAPGQESAIQIIESTIRRAHGLDAQQRVLATIGEISREIPENVNHLSPAMAEQLAGRFLKGLELCGELYAMAVSYELKMEILKRKEFSQAMLIRSAGVQGIKTAKEKEMFAFSEPIYMKAADTHVEAKMFRLFIEEKKDSFSKAHYLVRKVADRDQMVNDQNPGREAEWFQTSAT